MKPFYRDLFNLLHQVLFSADTVHSIQPSEIDWMDIYNEMRYQTVSALVYPWLKNNLLPNTDLQKRWVEECLRQQTRWIVVMHSQVALVNLMESHGIPCVIIKGSSSMISYPCPSLRAVGDVDFLVKRNDYERAASVLESNGYSLFEEKDSMQHHYSFIKNGITFELHKRLGLLKESDEMLLSLFEEGIDNRIWQSINGIRFPSLPTDLNGLVLIFHINQHLRGGIGLRHIIDWMMYIYKNQNIDEVLALVRSVGMEKLTKTVTVMCQQYFGLPEMIEPSIDYPCEELMEFIMNHGNFGIKTGIDGSIATVSLLTNTPGRLFAQLQKGGLIRWEAAKKYKLLSPFAWIYQIGYIVGRLIKNGITPKSFMTSHNAGVEQRNLIQKLGLDVDRSINKE